MFFFFLSSFEQIFLQRDTFPSVLFDDSFLQCALRFVLATIRWMILQKSWQGDD
jgi:hypothetical protein